MGVAEARKLRRAIVEVCGWGLTEAKWVEIDRWLDNLDTWESEDKRATAEVILVGLEVGSVADKIAAVTGLHRDGFVRPKAKLLRDNGIWSGGKTFFTSDAYESDENFMYELILLILVADGLVKKVATPDVDLAGERPPVGV